MSHESEKDILLRTAAEVFALIGDLATARGLANQISSVAGRTQALASASRHATEGERLRK
jgi:hypothetical protein